MSSPKAARSTAKRAAPARKSTNKTNNKTTRRTAAAKPAKAAKADSTSTQATQLATQLAATLERGLAGGNSDVVSERALQDLMAALCKTYSAQVEAGRQFLPLRGRTVVNGTDIMTTASGLLKAANLAVFELGMWQSWTGR